jgi:hypothetical protein
MGRRLGRPPRHLELFEQGDHRLLHNRQHYPAYVSAGWMLRDPSPDTAPSLRNTLRTEEGGPAPARPFGDPTTSGIRQDFYPQAR